MNSLDLAVVAGAGVAFNVSNGIQAFVDGSYSLGLTDIAKDDKTSGLGAVKSRDIRVTAGVMFSLQ